MISYLEKSLCFSVFHVCKITRAKMTLEITESNLLILQKRKLRPTEIDLALSLGSQGVRSLCWG